MILYPGIKMGFLDKLRKKKEDLPSHEASPGSGSTTTGEQPKRIKRYTSDGKPVYE